MKGRFLPKVFEGILRRYISARAPSVPALSLWVPRSHISGLPCCWDLASQPAKRAQSGRKKGWAAPETLLLPPFCPRLCPDEYVICNMCKSADTLLHKENRLHILRCQAVRVALCVFSTHSRAFLASPEKPSREMRE